MQHSGLSGTGLVSFTDAAWVAARLSAFMLLICMGAQVALAAPADDFVTTWQTDNSGTSNATSITVPMVGGAYDVDWNNDGIFDGLPEGNSDGKALGSPLGSMLGDKEGK